MSDARNELIDRRIDRETAGAITVQPHSGGMAAFALQPKSMSEVMEVAKLMAVSGVCIRQPFRNNPGACLAIVLQAMKWGADPFAVANKAFVVNDQVSYEAQLINAIVNSSTMLAKRLDATFDGQDERLTCRITGYIKGESEPREYLSPEVGRIPVKNSPLWKSDVQQQLYYYSSRAWARRWLPEVLLGIYTVDELTPVVDLTPASEPRPPRVADTVTRNGDVEMPTQLERFEERHCTAPVEQVIETFDPETGEVHDQESPAGLPPAAAPGTARAAAAMPAGEPDPEWLAEFNSLAPRFSDLGSDEPDWETYVQALGYLIGKASPADLAALEVSRNPHLQRLRSEDPDRYRSVTRAIATRAKGAAR